VCHLLQQYTPACMPFYHWSSPVTVLPQVVTLENPLSTISCVVCHLPLPLYQLNFSVTCQLLSAADQHTTTPHNLLCPSLDFGRHHCWCLFDLLIINPTSFHSKPFSSFPTVVCGVFTNPMVYTPTWSPPLFPYHQSLQDCVLDSCCGCSVLPPIVAVVVFLFIFLFFTTFLFITLIIFFFTFITNLSSSYLFHFPYLFPILSGHAVGILASDQFFLVLLFFLYHFGLIAHRDGIPFFGR